MSCGPYNKKEIFYGKYSILYNEFWTKLDAISYFLLLSDLYDYDYWLGEEDNYKFFYITYDIMDKFKLSIKFDVVICVSTLEHIPEKLRILAINNLISMLSKNGLLYLTMDLPIFGLNDFLESKLDCEFYKNCIANITLIKNN